MVSLVSLIVMILIFIFYEIVSYSFRNISLFSFSITFGGRGWVGFFTGCSCRWSDSRFDEHIMERKSPKKTSPQADFSYSISASRFWVWNSSTNLFSCFSWYFLLSGFLFHFLQLISSVVLFLVDALLFSTVFSVDTCVCRCICCPAMRRKHSWSGNNENKERQYSIEYFCSMSPFFLYLLSRISWGFFFSCGSFFPESPEKDQSSTVYVALRLDGHDGSVRHFELTFVLWLKVRLFVLYSSSTVFSIFPLILFVEIHLWAQLRSLR